MTRIESRRRQGTESCWRRAALSWGDGTGVRAHVNLAGDGGGDEGQARGGNGRRRKRLSMWILVGILVGILVSPAQVDGRANVPEILGRESESRHDFDP